MSYPPRLVKDQSGLFSPNGSAIGPDVLEKVPPVFKLLGQNGTRYDLVHFDLDPQNGEQARVP